MKETGLLMKPEMVRATLAGIKTQTRRVNGLDKINFDNGRPSAHMWSYAGVMDDGVHHLFLHADGINTQVVKCPYGKVGDRLWVRETWRVGAWKEGMALGRGGVTYKGGYIAVDYKADNHIRTEWLDVDVDDMFINLMDQSISDAIKAGIKDDYGDYKWEPGQSPCRWRPSIHMPRWASRIDLELVGIRAEKLQDISHEDALKEGIQEHPGSMELRDQRLTLVQLAFSYLWDSINAKRGYPWDDNSYVWVNEFRMVKS